MEIVNGLIADEFISMMSALIDESLTTALISMISQSHKLHRLAISALFISTTNKPLSLDFDNA